MVRFGGAGEELRIGVSEMKTKNKVITMKKVLVASLATMLVVGAAAQASAYFEQGNLVLVGYNENTNEVGIDLGAIGGGLDLSAQNVVIGSSFSLADVGVSSWDMVSVGAFADNSNLTTYNMDNFVANSSASWTGYSSTPTTRLTFSNNSQTVSGYYASLASAGMVIADPANAKSYDVKHNLGSNNPGSYSGINDENGTGEVNLGALATGGYVDLYLYRFGGGVQYNFDLVPGTTANYTAVLRLQDIDGNGTVETKLNPVPLPGAVWLFGSGLFGLFGLRRKNA